MIHICKVVIVSHCNTERFKKKMDEKSQVITALILEGLLKVRSSNPQDNMGSSEVKGSIFDMEKSQEDCKTFSREVFKEFEKACNCAFENARDSYDRKAGCYYIDGDTSKEDSLATAWLAEIKQSLPSRLKNNGHVSCLSFLELHIEIGLPHAQKGIDGLYGLSQYKSDEGRMRVDLDLFTRLLAVTRSRI